MSCVVKADVDIAPFNGWLTTEPQIVAYGVKLNELSGFTAWLGGAWMTTTIVDGQYRHVMANGYFANYQGGELIVDFQGVESSSSTYTKGVRVAFAQSGENITARVLFAALLTGHPPGDTAFVEGGSTPIATSDVGNGYGICQLRCRRCGDSRIAYPGYVALSAEDFQWPLWTLGNLVGFEAIKTGKSIRYPQHCSGYFITMDESGQTVQLQGYSRYSSTATATRAFKLELQPDEDSVLGKLLWCHYSSGNRIGEDFSPISAWGEQNIVKTDYGRNDDISIRSFVGKLRRQDYYDCDVYRGFAAETNVLFYVGRRLEDCETFSARMSGGYMTTKHQVAKACNIKRSANEIAVQFQVQEGVLKCVKVVFSQSEEGVACKVAYAKYSSSATIGYDFDTGGSSNSIATTDTGNGYGVYDVSVTKAISAAGVKHWVGNGESPALSVVANWAEGASPGLGDTLVFPFSITNLSVVCDLDQSTVLSNVVIDVGAPSLLFSGGSLRTSHLENRSSSKLTLQSAVVCEGDFEPMADGPIEFGTLHVGGVFAPQGEASVELNGISTLAALSPGNTLRRVTDSSDSLNSVLRYAVDGCGTNTIGRLSIDGALQHEYLDLHGENIIGSEFLCRSNFNVAVCSGRTRIPRLTLPESGATFSAAEGATLEIVDYPNEWQVSTRFLGPGRIAFGERGLAANSLATVSGTRFATCGSDWTIAGVLNVTAEVSPEITFDATDADGTGRTITLAPAFSISGAENAAINAAGGTLKLSDGLELAVPVAVLDGGAISAGGTATVARLSFSAGASVSVCESSFIDVQSGSVDLSGIDISLEKKGRYAGPVLAASGITGMPRSVVDSNGRNAMFVIRSFNDRQALYVMPVPRGLSVAIR